MAKPAIFWDRDDTLIRDPGYLDDPGGVDIVVTNQSGIARGLLDEATLVKIHEQMQKHFEDEGAIIDAIYYCPYLEGEEAVVKEYRLKSDLRKPKPGMIIKAALERKIDLAGSWALGDSIRDVQAGRAAGCRTIFLHLGDGGRPPIEKGRDVDFVARTLDEAVEIILSHTRQAKPAEQAAGQTGGRRESAAILQDILSFLRSRERQRCAEDFSLAMLAGALVQILAVGVLIWALFEVIQGELVGTELLFGIFLQLMAMTFFVVASRK